MDRQQTERSSIFRAFYTVKWLSRDSGDHVLGLGICMTALSSRAAIIFTGGIALAEFQCKPSPFGVSKSPFLLSCLAMNQQAVIVLAAVRQK